MLIYQDKLFEPYEYVLEKDFEREVVQHCRLVFGPEALYVD